jgi:hypothetical protein
LVEVNKRAGKILLGAVACVALGVTALGLVLSGPSAGIDDAQIKYQVRAAFTVELQMGILPAGSTPGHVTPETMVEIRARISELPKVMTGAMLAAQTDGYTRWLDQMATDENAGVFTEAGLDSIEFDGAASIAGTSATVSGSYTFHWAGLHFEHGKPVPEGRTQSQHDFTAELEKSNGVWLVSLVRLTNGVG